MLMENQKYVQDIKVVAQQLLNLEIKHKSFMVFGATGLIGQFLIDVVMEANKTYQLENTIIAVGRNRVRLESNFTNYLEDGHFQVLEANLQEKINFSGSCDYILQAASNTHPKAYATDPIGTITTNVIGTQNILDFAKSQKNSRTLFFSSVEIYGENRGDVDLFDENYLGYINSNTLRAGYPESKRAAEALCQAFIEKYQLDVLIIRLSRIIGPTVSLSDTKASTQFIKDAILENDVVLKSEGLQYYSYSYVADAVSAIFFLISQGITGEAYNVKGQNGDLFLKDFAKFAAEVSNKKVIFELPDETERKGFSTATKALMNDKKIKNLGWSPQFDVPQSIKQTIEILKEEMGKFDGGKK